jgi:hypothetical protein
MNFGKKEQFRLPDFERSQAFASFRQFALMSSVTNYEGTFHLSNSR